MFTINYKGQTLSITGDFIPGESMTLDHPRTKPTFQIELIFWNSHDVTELLDNLMDLSEIELLTIEEIEK
jgi:hypothetical protein